MPDDVNTRIARWRRELRRLGVRRTTAIELECHLRDGVSHLTKAGLSPSAAFERAAADLGDPGQLAQVCGRDTASSRRLTFLLAILWSVFLIAVYRIGFFIPLPGVDQVALEAWVAQSGITPQAVRLLPQPLVWGPSFFVPLLPVLWLAGLLVIGWRIRRSRLSGTHHA